MAEQQTPAVKLPDPLELSKAMTQIAERSNKLLAEFLERQKHEPEAANVDPLNIGGAFLELTSRMMSDPARLAAAQMQLWQDYMRLWDATTRRMLGETAAPVAVP